MRYICTKCGSDNLEYDLWMDVRTGIPVEHGTPVYYCNKCEALVDVTRLEDEETTIDPEPAVNNLDKLREQNTTDAGWSDYEYGPD